MRYGGYISEDCTIVESLKSCGKNRDAQGGARLHAMLVRKGLLEKNPYIASSLISMYAKCGMVGKAHAILDDLPCRNEVSWSALIAGYAQQGQGRKALDCFDHMQNEGLLPDPIAFTCVLKACGSIRDLEKGKQIHEEIANRGFLQKDILLGTALVDMYAKCGMLTMAAEVLNEIAARTVVSWNALMDGYVQQGQACEAFKCLEQMQTECLSPDVVTYISILKACSQTGDICKGKQVHHEILARGLLVDHIMLGNALLDMYAKCGMLAKAQQVHDELPIRDSVSWNALIAGYAQQEQGYKALKCFDQMQMEGLYRDTITFVCGLKACGSTKSFGKGKQIHNEVAQRRLLEKDTALGTALVDMYAKCGVLTKAKQVLDELPFRNVVIWSALIAGYTEQGYFCEALNYFEQMQNECFSPDEVTFTCIVKACGSIRDRDKAKQIHHEIISRGFLEKDSLLETALLDMYTKFEVCLNEYDGLHFQSFSWFDSHSAKYNSDCILDKLKGKATVRPSHGKSSMGKEKLYNENDKKDFAIVNFLRSCTNKEFSRVCISVEDIPKKSPFVANNLISMYVEHGMLAKARQILERIPIRNVVSWNALIAGYARHGQGQKALNCFGEMQRDGVSPNAITLTCILKACGNTSDVEKGKQIHDGIVSMGLLENDVVLGTALVDMYAKCGFLQKAQEQHLQLLVRDVVSWNALIAIYARERKVHEALISIGRMQCEGLSPDVITFTSALIACSGAGAINKGKQVHNEIVIKNLLEQNMELCNALVDMYTKCGALTKAKQVLLHELPARNVVTWNTLISGYAREGQGQEALNCFEQMQREGIAPDAISLLCILKVFSQTRLYEAQLYFKNMSGEYGITTNLEHFTSMVFSFGHAGHFDKAMSMIRTMPSSDYPPLWLALLSVCKRWGNVELGRFAFDQLVQLNNHFASAHVLNG